MYLLLNQSARNRRIRRVVTLYLLLSLMAPCAELRANYSVSEFTSVTSAQEKRIDVIRDQEIKQIGVILGRPLPQEQRADLLLRLAELYTEKYRFYFSKENEIWLKKIDAHIHSGNKGSRPKLDQGESRKWIDSTLGVLKKIPTEGGRYSRMDEVYYFLGFHYWEQGKKSDSVRTFQKLVSSYPKSKFVSEGYRHIADYQFSKRDFKSARTTYERALRGAGNSPLKPRMLYGLAWSLFKQGDNMRAADTMKAAIQSARELKSIESGFALERDAVDALVLFYSEGGSLSKAPDYFRETLGEQGAFDALKKLAKNYQQQGKYSSALAINKHLLESGNTSSEEGERQRFDILLDGLRVAGNKGQRDKEIALLTTMTNDFVVNSKINNEERIEKVRNLVRRAATLAHREGNKSKSPRQAFERAEDTYRLYLSAFSDRIKAEDRAEIRYYLADVLSQLGKHKAAASEFKQIVELAESDSAYKKYQKDAASGMIYSLDAFFKGESQNKKLSRSDTDELISAIDSYVRLYPGDKESTKYLARATGLLVTSKRMDEARPRLLHLIEQHPKSPDALEAAVLLMKDAEDRKEWAQVAELSEKFLGNSALMAQDKKGTLRKQLEGVAARAKFKAVRDVEENQDFAAAAIRYEQLAEGSRDNEVRYKALNNAAVNFAKAGDKENEKRIYKKILAIYPTATVGDGILATGNQEFIKGNYAEAAAQFESYFHLYGLQVLKAKPAAKKTAVEALRSAAILRSAIKDHEKAGENYRDLVTLANKGVTEARDASEEFLIDSARRLRDQGNLSESIKAFQKYLGAFSKGTYAAESTLEIGILYGKLEETEKAQNYISNTISRVKSNRKNASIDDLGHAAHARLMLLKPLEDSFEKSPLRLPESQLKQDIKNKLAALERLNKGYIEVIEFGEGRWGMEAFLRMAKSYRAFGESLVQAPTPREFSEEDQAKFRAQLLSVAKPVFQKVGDTLENALRKGEQLRVVDPVMAKIYVMAVVLAARPDRLPLYQAPNWGSASDWIMGGSGSVEKARETLLRNDKDAHSYVTIGNFHVARGEWELARIFYLRALDKKAKYAEALNNLAYLNGRDGNFAAAHAGFKAALDADEFAIEPKRNISRLYMASGLWRHANLFYRQLHVRVPTDQEIRRGLGLSYLALGRAKDAEPYRDSFSSGGSFNASYAEAIWKLANGDTSSARGEISSIANDNEIAAILNQEWIAKEDGK